MPPVVPASGGMQGPSTFDKLKMGAMMGGCMYLTDLYILGTVSIMQYGAGPNGVMRTLGKFMLGSGATFGFFMSIGSVIRTEGTPNSYHAWSRTRGQPFIMPRQYHPRPQRS
ncbi:hypothetical protein AJ80_06321 [Polytolypa hystricis UAMH7299]|uniref:Mitochondrial genome maintenance protein Mgr2 n=1 Tax=Polytolypa hystricis (strain UAMH7299) TaxID=1447883 RepID=A0A2B7XXV4_POLH7|nr:hypothetical protein AJ80_06321 [Polytolypa hystricis UAMH7299]